MDGRPIQRPFSFATFALLAAISAVGVGCDRPEKTPDPRPDAAVKPAPVVVEGLNLSDLVDQAQVVRDREFAAPPALSPVSEPYKRIAPDSVRADRDAILYGLFGRTDSWDPFVIPEQRIAWWDAGENMVKLRTDLEVEPGAREQAVLLALLHGLDAQHRPESPAPDTWDGYLADQAVRHGPTYFALSYHLARQQQTNITLKDVAQYPGVIGELDVRNTMLAPDGSLEAKAAAFGPRQGHGLAAAMYRASGWNGVEMLWHDRPDSTAWIVRPDRWLGGDGMGDWEWPKIPTQIREKNGWKLERAGRVGPAITALFLSKAVSAAASRTVYVTWLSDSYRSWRKGDSWLFEWVTMWETPTAAEEFVAAAQQALAKQGRDGRFSVMRRGTTVALLGSDDTDEDLDRHATSVVSLSPRFQPREKGMIGFVYTPADLAADGISEATLADNVWSDPYVGLKVNTAPLADWDLRKAQELNIRWFARNDGALIQFSTELPRPLAPSFTDDAWRQWVIDGFKKSVGRLKVVAAERAGIAGRSGWVFEFTGEVEGRPSRLILRQALSEPDRGSQTPRVVTMSLQEPLQSDAQPTKSVGESALDAIELTIVKPWKPEPESTPDPESGGLLPRNE